ncbi:hypothetical protein ACFQ1M_02700 [Sungkyunkwania multivorans]|uniref:Lipoprotein n=1 Tax=Sungkyunkwania multivorans TaxID=1173618 RepID=A0ABW3CTL3_9FLAO
MKTLKNIFGLLLTSALTLSSCSTSDDADPMIFDTPTAEEFSDLREQALDALRQDFQFDTNDGSTTFTSANGVDITINAACLSLNGNAVTGTVDIEYVELFDKANMLATNKPTMGVLPSGDKAMLISGGEFFIEATQAGQEIDLTCNVQLVIPTALTGGPDNEMTLWTGIIDEDGDLAWEEARDATGQGGVFAEGGEYYAFLNEFGWSNVDRFYNDPRPKTTLLVDAPDGYDYENSAVYLSYDGEETGLANLDTYVSGMFSEHYGQIPVGLECHVIFVTEEDGNWRYAIKSVTIAANDVITIDLNETIVGTQAQLTTAINGLP